MFNSNKINTNTQNIILGTICGIGLSYLFSKLKKFLNLKKKLDTKESTEDKEIRKINGTEEEKVLIREQLKRNYEFFGNEGMKLITDSFVCVVGIGGVGR